MAQLIAASPKKEGGDANTEVVLAPNSTQPTAGPVATQPTTYECAANLSELEHRTRWKVAFLMHVLLNVTIAAASFWCGQATMVDCGEATWNPITYWQQSKATMSSPWASDEVWTALKEQQRTLVGSALVGVVSIGAAYIGGPKLALQAAHGGMTLLHSRSRQIHMGAAATHSCAQVIGSIPTQHQGHTPPQHTHRTVQSNAKHIYPMSFDGSENWGQLMPTLASAVDLYEHSKRGTSTAHALPSQHSSRELVLIS